MPRYTIEIDAETEAKARRIYESGISYGDVTDFAEFLAGMAARTIDEVHFLEFEGDPGKSSQS